MRWNRTSVKTLAYWMKVLGAVVSILMFVVWEHVEAQHLERQVGAMRKEEDQLTYQNARMQSQINQWLSPSHLERVARKDMGMVPLDPQHRVRVELP